MKSVFPVLSIEFDCNTGGSNCHVTLSRCRFLPSDRSTSGRGHPDGARTGVGGTEAVDYQL